MSQRCHGRPSLVRTRWFAASAIAAFKSYHARSPGFGLTGMVIAYQQTGQVEEARRTAEQLIMVRPNFPIDAWLKIQFRRDTVGVEADTDCPARRRASVALSAVLEDRELKHHLLRREMSR